MNKDNNRPAKDNRGKPQVLKPRKREDLGKEKKRNIWKVLEGWRENEKCSILKFQKEKKNKCYKSKIAHKLSKKWWAKILNVNEVYYTNRICS